MHDGPVDGTIEDVLVATRYRLRDEIDGGGWRATDRESGRSVVLVRLTRDALPQARMAATVRHPHLVSILDVVEEPDAWLVREDVSARSLADLVAEYGPMSAAAAALVGAQVASGLAAAHAADVAHGALTPGDILVEDAGIGPFAKVSGVGTSPATDTGTDVSALGAALSAAVGDHSERLGPLLQQLTAEDPAVRPTAEQAHDELARLAATLAGPAPKGPPPTRRRLRVLGLAAAGAAVVITAVVAALAALTAPSVAPITPADERTLDTCSLIDVAALAPVGKATIRPGYGAFSSCVVAIPIGVNELQVDVDLVTGDTADPFDASLRDPLNPVVVPISQDDYFCRRYILLPDGHVLSIDAVLYGEEPTDGIDYCAVADLAAHAAVTRLVADDLAHRSSDADRSALAGIRACDLLDQDSVTAAVTAAGGDPVGARTDGSAGWSCDWGPVWLDFMRESAPGAPDFYGDPAPIGGRPGMTRTDGAGVCRAYIPQRFFIAADSTMRAEYVRIYVQGTADSAAICRAAVDLAERVATRLPAFG